MSVKSAAALVATVTAALVLGTTPAAALANAVMHVDAASPPYATGRPPAGVIDCTADPAFRFVRPCMIRKGTAEILPK